MILYSPIGRSAQFCSVLFEVNLHDLGGVTRRLAWQLYNRDMYCHKDDINVICELLAVKHGNLELDLFSNSVLNVFIESPCTNKFFTCAYFLCVLLYDFHNKINSVFIFKIHDA